MSEISVTRVLTNNRVVCNGPEPTHPTPFQARLSAPHDPRTFEVLGVNSGDSDFSLDLSSAVDLPAVGDVLFILVPFGECPCCGQATSTKGEMAICGQGGHYFTRSMDAIRPDGTMLIAQRRQCHPDGTVVQNFLEGPKPSN